MKKINDRSKTLALTTETLRTLADDSLRDLRGAYGIPTIPVVCHHSAVRSSCCPP